MLRAVDKRRFVAVTLAAALGFSLWDVLRGISTLVTVYADDANVYRYSPLSWTVGGRTLTIYQAGSGAYRGRARPADRVVASPPLPRDVTPVSAASGRTAAAASARSRSRG